MFKKSRKYGVHIEMNQLENASEVIPVNEVILLGEVKDEGYSSTVAGSPLFTHKQDQIPDTSFIDNSVEKVEEERETWARKADFLLSIIGFAVDLANVWRFPYLCYKNGGGAFLVPYALMLVFGAIPLFYMELILGQYNRSGPITVWKISPIFKGIGYCATLVSFYVAFYYNAIIGWAFYFLFASFKSELPWTSCNNEWNTDRCWNGSHSEMNSSIIMNTSKGINMSSAAHEYFHRKVLELHKSHGFHDLGSPRWPLVLCLLLVFFILFLSLCKGVKSSGKVVWVTATMPYVVLTILLIRGATLPGAQDGILYYIRPDLTRLLSAEVWIDAAVQIFFSVGAGFGVHLSYASYNKFHNNCYRDCLCTAAVNSLTSFFSGFVIFAYLGYMAAKQGVHINKVAAEGPGLVFVVYPEAIATLPGSVFWAVLFFFMLLMLGLDSAMGGMECVLTGILDEFRPFFSRWRYSREVLTAIVCSIAFFIALVNTTQGGAYMVQWFDVFAAGVSLLGVALFEAIAVSWFYGMEQFSQDIHEMMGFKPGIFWRICWKFISPTFLLGIIISAIVLFQPLKYGPYIYPGWANVLGWIFACSSLAVIPGYAIGKLISGEGTWKQRIALGITPTREHQVVIRTGTVKRFKLRHWLQV